MHNPLALYEASIAAEFHAMYGNLPLEAWRSLAADCVSELDDDIKVGIAHVLGGGAPSLAIAPHSVPQRSLAAGRQRLVSIGITPRGLALDDAAAYVGLSTASFKSAIEAGRLPRPLPVGSRRPTWDLAALNAALDRLSKLTPQASVPVLDMKRDMAKAIQDADL